MEDDLFDEFGNYIGRGESVESSSSEAEDVQGEPAIVIDVNFT